MNEFVPGHCLPWFGRRSNIELVDLGLALGYPLDLTFDGSDRLHVLIKFSPVGYSEVAVERPGIIHDEIKNASMLLVLLDCKEPVEHGLRVTKGPRDMAMAIP